MSDGDEIFTEIDSELIGFMLKHERLVLIDMVKSSWLPAHVMRMVFDQARDEGGLLRHLSRISLSHPDAQVRAMATEELLAFIPLDELGRHLWA